MMRLRKLGAALVVVAALGAVLASSALAALTNDVRWYTGASPGTLLPEKDAEGHVVTESMSAQAVGTGTFTTKVAGTTYKLQSTQVECVECKIQNSGGAAIGSGQLRFRSVSVVEPAGCFVASEITTASLSVQADWMGATDIEFPKGSKIFITVETATPLIKFVPTKGETTAFATIEITGCALATTLIPKGSVFVESANATGTQAVAQEVHSSGAINAAAGGSLKVGTETAELATNLVFRMSGAKFGTAFGTH